MSDWVVVTGLRESRLRSKELANVQVFSPAIFTNIRTIVGIDPKQPEAGDERITVTLCPAT